MTALAVEVRLTVLAVMVPTELVRAPEEERLTVPMVPEPATRLPATSRVPALTLREKVDAFPAEEAPRETAAAVSLLMLTLPVELRDSVPALRVLPAP